MKLEELRHRLADAIRCSRFQQVSFFVGGCVRDELLQRSVPLLDADLAVELPRGGIALAQFLAQKLKLAEPEIHPAFGTAKLDLFGLTLEFVMTREELYRPGNRFPSVRYADLSKDCTRRDFTVNALYQKLCDGSILDPCKMGLPDLEKRLIRSIRDPYLSFREDPLRILRALRFAAVLDFELEPQTWQALCELAPLVQNLSRQRLEEEKQRLKNTANPEQLQRWQSLAQSCGASTLVPI